jgi:hypothetical protein
LVQIKFITEDSGQTHIQILILNENYFNRKVYKTNEKEATKHGLAWKIQTDSILIKEKRNTYLKRLTGCQKC